MFTYLRGGIWGRGGGIRDIERVYFILWNVFLLNRFREEIKTAGYLFFIYPGHKYIIFSFIYRGHK